MVILVNGWWLLGALIGLAAAQRRGFNVLGGAIGGALLGPLAFLMFFVSGLASKGDMNVAVLQPGAPAKRSLVEAGYSVAPKPRPAWMTAALFVVCALGSAALGWLSGDTAAKRRPAQVVTIEVPARSTARTPGNFAPQLAQAEEQVNDLRNRLMLSEARAGTAEQEAERYRLGLERATATLNRITGSGSESPTIVVNSRPAAAPARVATPTYYEPNPWISVYGVVTQVLPDRIIVSATARNASQTAAGLRTVTITLLEDGRSYRHETQRIDLGMSTSVPVTATFYGTPSAGRSYAARVDVS